MKQFFSQLTLYLSWNIRSKREGKQINWSNFQDTQGTEKGPFFFKYLNPRRSVMQNDIEEMWKVTYLRARLP